MPFSITTITRSGATMAIPVRCWNVCNEQGCDGRIVLRGRRVVEWRHVEIFISARFGGSLCRYRTPDRRALSIIRRAGLSARMCRLWWTAFKERISRTPAPAARRLRLPPARTCRPPPAACPHLPPAARSPLPGAWYLLPAACCRPPVVAASRSLPTARHPLPVTRHRLLVARCLPGSPAECRPRSGVGSLPVACRLLFEERGRAGELLRVGLHVQSIDRTSSPKPPPGRRRRARRGGWWIRWAVRAGLAATWMGPSSPQPTGSVPLMCRGVGGPVEGCAIRGGVESDRLGVVTLSKGGKGQCCENAA